MKLRAVSSGMAHVLRRAEQSGVRMHRGEDGDCHLPLSRRNDVGHGQSAGESAKLEAVARGQDEELREGGMRSRGTVTRARTATRTSGWHCFT